MKHTLIMHAVIAGLLLSSVAFAQDETDSADGTVEVKDHNKGHRDDNKSRGNRDNKGGELSNRTLRVIDTDKDGQVSVEEYMQHAQQRFDDMDLDGNNFISSAEAKEAAEIMRAKQKEARSNLNERKRHSATESTSE